MTRMWFKTLTALLWLAPLAIAFRYWQVWDRLPIRVPGHFDAAGRANGWMTRDVSLYYALGFMGLMASVFSAVLFVVQAKYSLTRLSWALLAFFHAESWTFAYMLNSGLDYNLGGTPIAVSPLPIVSAVGVLAIGLFAFWDNRGKALSRTDVLAEEIHSGKAWGALFLLPLIGLAPAVLAVPNPSVRLAMGCVGVLMFAAFAMAWDGFHYYFTRHGVEIRTLGFRLKSIPLLQIKRYEIQNWNVLRGLGIRGIGNCKAYVWGKTGVRVEMYDGEVFLGHDDPQRIVHDLNVIKRYQVS